MIPERYLRVEDVAALAYEPPYSIAMVYKWSAQVHFYLAVQNRLAYL
jgi:hypothetical protein